MKKIQIYTTKMCPYCISAKRLLDNVDISYTETVIKFGSDELKELVKKTNFRTVPQIFIGEEMIGGYTELKKLIDENKLMNMISD